MTALELTIYPFQTEQYPSGYRIERDGFITRIGAANRAESKHLTDAELAAEWHAVDAEYAANFWDDIAPAILGPMRGTLHRFATAPHYYEEQE